MRLLRPAAALVALGSLGWGAAPPEPGRFVWISAPEPAAGETLLDLRPLNDAHAGARGPAQRRGDQLVDGAGRPLRFWGLSLPAAAARLDPVALRALARRLSRSGVNLVRLVVLVDAPEDSAGIPAVVAAMKAEGISSALVVEAGDGSVLALADVQARWRATARALLSRTGTGLAGSLARDPAVVFVEAGGGSVFGPGFSRAGVSEVEWQKLENAFADWSRSRYGSIANCRGAWLEAKEPGDDPSGGWLTLYDAWHLGRDGLQGAGPGLRRRATDQARFLGGLEQGMIAGLEQFLHRELKSRALLLAPLPVTVDPAVLDAPVQWARGRADALGVTAAFAASGEVDRTSGTGTFGNRSLTEFPEASPFRFIRSAGQPCVVTSLAWPPPNLYRADGPWLAAVQASLTGVAAVIWQDGAGAFGDEEPAAPGTAAVFGSFPACAALFRSGAVRAAPPAVTQTLDPEDLWRLEVTGRERALPPDRLAPGDGPVGDLDPLAFAVGPVLRVFSAKRPGERRSDLARASDRAMHLVTPPGGAFAWDSGHGVARLDLPSAQGVAGFLSRLPAIALSRVTINCENDFAAVLVLALDGLSLDRSRRILAQVMTPDAPSGFRASNGTDGEIQSAGSGPWTLERVRGSITIRGGHWTGAVVRAVDGRGIALPETVVSTASADGDGLTLALAPTGLAYLITRTAVP